MDLCNEIIWCNKFEVELVLKDYMLSEIELIENIFLILNVNVIKFVVVSYMIWGVISKFIKKLIVKNIIESY